MSIKKSIQKSTILDISITYGNDKIKFNLVDELMISENKINDEIKEQPGYFGFLLVLVSKLKRTRDDKKASLKKIYWKKFLYYKDQSNDIGRKNSNDIAEGLAINSKAYEKAENELNVAEENLGIIEAAVNSFEQRAHLIQSLSANLREERSNNN